MKSTKTVSPLKRHKALQPVSREHHAALLLSWKIQTGLKNGAGVNRIKNYCDLFYKYQVQPHFEIEEKHLFPVLGKNDPLVRQATNEHKELRQLFEDETASVENLEQIAQRLSEHIRFEERVLFNVIQKAACQDDLEKIAAVHPEHAPICKDIDEWDDIFWEYPY